MGSCAYKEKRCLDGRRRFYVGVMGVKGNMEMKRVSSPRGSKDTLSIFRISCCGRQEVFIFGIYTKLKICSFIFHTH